MANNDLLSKLGVYVLPNFLDEQTCKSIVAEMGQAPKKQAEVRRGNAEKKKVNVKIRETHSSQVSETTRQQVIDKYVALMPEMEKFFDTSLTGIKKPQFLFYSKGSFFAPHQDVIESERPRKISTVLFLNQQERNNRQGEYKGGELCLYGLNEFFKDKAFPVPASEGLLVAFRSDVLHEVKPVLSGTRCSLVMWYY